MHGPQNDVQPAFSFVNEKQLPDESCSCLFVDGYYLFSFFVSGAIISPEYEMILRLLLVMVSVELPSKLTVNEILKVYFSPLTLAVKR